MNRRDALLKSALILGTGLLGKCPSTSLFRLGACDWSIGKRMNPDTFEIAKAIGLQGLQVSYNTSSDERGLSDPTTLKSIKEAAIRTGVQVSSLAIGELNRTPYKSEPKTQEWVGKSIEAARELGVKVILLAFFSKNDLRDDETGQRRVIQQLKAVAPHAEKLGITLGIESYLSAQEHLKMIEAVGSKAVKVYYDSRNSTDAGHDIYKEIPLLGSDMICELHMKENGFRLGEGTIDWLRVSELLRRADYKGWMQIEGATPPNADIIECYRYNRRFLERIFDFS